MYRICKSFTVESGHMLLKHPGLCRFPHGHSRRIEVVLASPTLDQQDMVCDFKAIKLALGDFLGRFDHSMAMNSADPMVKNLESMKSRLVLFEDTDPTTEVLAEHIFRFLDAELRAGKTYSDAQGVSYRFPPGLKLERVRVSETESTWAEFTPE
ncbi:MAG: 6-carboxytetrahydropterin synthase [Phycisphaerales bacterium]|nr:6-carboxytetrahydropterin synthase [Phycisphaerales bacterium]